MKAEFNSTGVRLALDKSEYIFLHLALSHLLHGLSIPDHDFINIMGLSREEAEELLESLVSSEREARRSGEHWNV